MSEASVDTPTGEGPRRGADERRRELMRIGRTLVPRLWGLLRSLAIYPPGNEAPQRSLDQLLGTVDEVHLLDESAALVVLADAAFLDGCRLRMDSSTRQVVPHLDRYFADRDIGGVCIHAGYDRERLMAFFAGLHGCAQRQHPREMLYALMAQERIDEVTLIHPQRVQTDEQVEQFLKLEAVEVYARTLNSLRRDAADDRGVVGFRRRQQIAVRRLVDLAELDYRTFLQLPALRGLGTPLLEHTVNATVLALALGRAAGMDRRPLLELGIAAMNRDIGPAGDGEALLDPERQPLASMRAILGRHGVGFRTLLRGVVAAEHHRYHDGHGGYPDLPDRPPHLFSNIVALCAAYDALTCPRPGGGHLLPPDALIAITSSAGIAFDPRLVRVFVAMMGRYPPGTVVELDGEGLGIVLACGPGPEGQSRPLVMRVRDLRGQDIPVLIVDTAERSPGSDELRHRIARAVDPMVVDLDVPALLFSADAALAAE